MSVTVSATSRALRRFSRIDYTGTLPQKVRLGHVEGIRKGTERFQEQKYRKRQRKLKRHFKTSPTETLNASTQKYFDKVAHKLTQIKPGKLKIRKLSEKRF